MIGHEADARFIRDWWVEGERMIRSTPDGWRLLGSGCYRTAYLHEDSNVVYKLDRHKGWSRQSNERENTQLRSKWLLKLPKGWRFPRWNLFLFEGDGVMAMERVDTLIMHCEVPEIRERWDEDRYTRLSYMSDLHDENVGVDEKTGELIIIDWGM